MPCLIELIEGTEQTRITRLQTELLARLRINTVVQCYLQNLWCVQITRQQISLFAESPHLDTARAAALTSILQCLTSTYHLLHISVGVEHRRIAMPLTYHLNPCKQKLVRRILSDMDAQTWL